MNKHNRLALAVSLICGGMTSGPLLAEEMEQESLRLEPIVITTPLMRDPQTLSLDTRQPQLPLPAQDGGAFLKSIPGFNVSRKGGTSGDPELRGLGGSRLGILLGDSQVFGGCSNRMDPPTAYVFPQAYDRVEVVKGPQSVRYGASPAGVVRFERDKPVFTEATTEGFASMTIGSFARTDLMADVTGGDENGYIRLIGTLSEQDDYQDGEGDRVHSNYQRWSGSGIIGWTPGSKSHLELSYDRSDGQAAYDDRHMDGTEFDRTAYQLAYSQRNLTEWLDEISLTLFESRIDHSMDNYTLREPAATMMNPMGMPMVRFPQRHTRGARLTFDSRFSANTALFWGLDVSRDEHSDNRLMGAAAFGWRDADRDDTARFENGGLFAELEHELSARSALNMGLRVDQVSARAESEFGGAEDGDKQEHSLSSGFIRYSQAMQNRPVTLTIGVGHAERAADFWERDRVFDLRPETLTQLDAGMALRGNRLASTLSVFYGEFDDYILIAASAPQARNIEATTWGAEADLTVTLSERFSLTGSAAWVRSHNDSDDQPLAQTPPPEATISLDYADDHRFAGIQARGVARQDRIHEGHGTIYSLDSEETSGFGTMSLYLGRTLFNRTRITLGVDNLFNRAYAEHIQRGSAELGASAQAINEPGRVLWANLNTRF